MKNVDHQRDSAITLYRGIVKSEVFDECMKTLVLSKSKERKKKDPHCVIAPKLEFYVIEIKLPLST